MDVNEATEIAYKNGYAQGKADATREIISYAEEFIEDRVTSERHIGYNEALSDLTGALKERYVNRKGRLNLLVYYRWDSGIDDGFNKMIVPVDLSKPRTLRLVEIKKMIRESYSAGHNITILKIIVMNEEREGEDTNVLTNTEGEKDNA